MSTAGEVRVEIDISVKGSLLCCMAKYEGPKLKHVEPNLRPGEKEIIAQFHDESSVHVNEYKASAW